MRYRNSFLVCLAILSIPTMARYCANASPSIIRVPGDYSKIQDAINHATPGGIIRVASGTYRETLYINKTLTLIGENKNGATLVGNGNGTVIQADSTSVSISGLTIVNADTGIWLEKCSESIVEENKIDCFVDGIWLHYSNSNIVSNNLVVNSNNSGIILCGGSSNNIIIGNTIVGNVTGLTVTGTNNLIYHNSFISNKKQALMLESFNNTWNNSCEGNYWSDYNGTTFNKYGIGDSPYVIDSNNQDNFPLRSPYITGDVDHTSNVNIVDMSIIAKAFATKPGDIRWNPYADIDENGIISIIDISEAARNFGKEWKEP